MCILVTINHEGLCCKKGVLLLMARSGRHHYAACFCVHAPSQAQPLLAQALQRVYHRHLSHDESRDHIVKYYLLQ